MWEWVWYILMFLVLLAGLFINLLGLPGLWLMLGVAGVYAFMTDQLYLGLKSLVALLILALGAEAVEFIAGAAGSKSAGGSKRGMVGAIVGGLIGGVLGTGIPVPIVGTIVGAIVGAFAGAAIVEYMIRKDVEHSMRVGIGAAKGRFWGTVFKTAFGIAMLIVAMIAGFPK